MPFVEVTCLDDARLLFLQGGICNIEELLLLHVDFDCFIINCNLNLSNVEVERIANAVAKSNAKWVETFGAHAERLHDSIDEASVRIGRQVKIGDGNPMTAWHDQLQNLDEILDFVLTGGLGYCNVKLLIVSGDEIGEHEIASRLRRNKQNKGDADRF